VDRPAGRQRDGSRSIRGTIVDDDDFVGDLCQGGTDLAEEGAHASGFVLGRQNYGYERIAHGAFSGTW
jgi:hypothetical protein